MSTEENTNLLQRAADLLDEIQSHPSGYDRALQAALESNDLEETRYWVTIIEAEMSTDDIRNYDLVVF